MSIRTDLILSAHRALFRATPKEVNAIYCKIEETTLIWHIYCDEELSELDEELLRIASTEIAADFPEITAIDEQFIVHPKEIDFGNTEYFDWAFARL